MYRYASKYYIDMHKSYTQNIMYIIYISYVYIHTYIYKVYIYFIIVTHPSI